MTRRHKPNALISVTWTYGRPTSSAEKDESRAIKAAVSVFRRYEADILECKHEFRRFVASSNGFDYEYAQGSAAIWVEAQRAADLALTKGWHAPGEASCEIDAEPL